MNQFTNRTMSFDEVSNDELSELRVIIRAASDSHAMREAIHFTLAAKKQQKEAV